MFAPVRSLTAYRPQSSPGVLASLAMTTAIFSATPFLVPEIARHFGIGLGPAGVVSTAQVGGFALASFVAGRTLSPSRSILAVAGIVILLGNTMSALAPSFGLLLLMRGVTGMAMGTVTWVGWAQGSRIEGGIAEVAAMGPVVAGVASPILSQLTEMGGIRSTYLALAGITLIATLIPATVVPTPPVGRAVSDSRSNRVLLGALVMLTLSGSALFVFCASVGARAGLAPFAVSMAFSMNALAGLVATRLHSRRPGLWLAVTTLAALLTGTVSQPWAFLTGMTAWGFAFWMAVPPLMRMLAERSLRPEERMGDAQSLMAAGRMIGPALGGAVLGVDRFAALAWCSAGLMGTSAATVTVVERRRAQSASTP